MGEFEGGDGGGCDNDKEAKVIYPVFFVTQGQKAAQQMRTE